MTTYGAYDAGLPCKNPSCKSHGVPHPNCRCYGNMADGGSAAPFCSLNRPHKLECEYYADGGDVIDPSQVVVDRPTADAAQEIPSDQVKIDENQPNDTIDPDQVVADKPEDRYSTTGQQILTGIEGAGQGVIGPLMPLAEATLSKLGVPGLSAEERSARENANPAEYKAAEAAGFAGSMYFGVGEFRLAAKLAEGAAGLGTLGKLGQAAIKGLVGSETYAIGDEASKWLNDKQDPADAVAGRLAVNGVLGLLTGGIGYKAGSVAKTKLQEIAAQKIGQRMTMWLEGVGSALQGASEAAAETASNVWEQGSKKAFIAGQKFGARIANVPTMVGAGEAVRRGYKGYEEGGLEEGFKQAGVGILEGLMAKGATKTGAYAIPRILSSGIFLDALQTIDYVAQSITGSDAASQAVDAVFGAAPAMVEKTVNSINQERDREKLNDFLENGGIDSEILNQSTPSQPFAAGGAVIQSNQSGIIDQSKGIAAHYPEQNVILNAAKARVSNYLNSLRPTKNNPKLAFDPEPNDATQKKTYDQALNIAINPLSVLAGIKKGTVDPSQVKHLNALYPEVSALLQKKITERIIKAQMSGERPTHQVRQGLSMFMGTALSSELQPANIIAAQSVFANKQQAQQAPVKKSGNTDKLSKSDQAFLTGGQALSRRAQRV